MSKHISFVIPCRDDAARLITTIKSIVDHSIDPGNHEFIVVDDCSSYGQSCWDVIRDNLLSQSNFPSEIRVIATADEGSVGPAISRVIGIRQVRHEHIVTLDSHITIVNGLVENLSPSPCTCVSTLMKCPPGIPGYFEQEMKEHRGGMMFGYNKQFNTLLPYFPRVAPSQIFNCYHGGFYSMNRTWWEEKQPYLGLTGYGGEEQALALAMASDGCPASIDMCLTIYHDNTTHRRDDSHAVEHATNRLRLIARYFGPDRVARLIQTPDLDQVFIGHCEDYDQYNEEFDQNKILKTLKIEL